MISGAEAAANALLTNRDAILFNPAALAAEKYGLDMNGYSGTMTAYVLEGEIIDRNNNMFLNAQPIGTREYLNNDYGTISGHYIDNVIRELVE